MMRARPLTAILLWAVATAGVPPDSVSRLRDSRRVMGTFFEIQVHAEDAPPATDTMTRALDEAARVDRLLSNYDPDSELSAMNREASHAPFHALPELSGFVD